MTTEAPETIAKPPKVTSDSAPADSADATTAPTAQKKNGCGSSVSVGFIVIAALIPAAVFSEKENKL